jgi:hypothetical protein
MAHVRFLESLGFGFGQSGSQPGQLYDFNEVVKRTPDDPGVTTRVPR